MAGNKLSIYLIKEGITQDNDILKPYQKSISLGAFGTFYADPSTPRPPSWKVRFFGNTLDQIDYLFQSTSKCVLLVPVQYNQRQLIFALTFGTGRHLLKELAIEERFGLLVTLNSVYADSIRSIEKNSIGANAKSSREQLSKPSGTLDFGFDIEQEMLKALTGRSRFSELGKTVSGADVLSVTVDVNIRRLDNLLKFCYTRYKSTDYQKDFDWIDKMKSIKDRGLIDKLNEQLIRALKAGTTDNIWVAIPDIIDWTDVAGFKYIPHKREPEDEIDIQSLIDSFDEDELDIAALKGRTITVMSASADAPMNHWPAIKCIYAEIIYRGKQYVLNNALWYEVNADFVTSINQTYNEIPISTVQLPEYDHDNEGAYNIAAAESNAHFLMMDKKTIPLGGGSNKIEFCDVYSKEKQMVHIKHTGASSVLSHLFMQGLNAGEALVANAKFRSDLNDKLHRGWKLRSPQNKINTPEYEIVYAIINNHPGPRPRMPFFSKISLKTAYSRLTSFGYKVTLKHIQSLR